MDSLLTKSIIQLVVHKLERIIVNTLRHVQAICLKIADDQFEN